MKSTRFVRLGDPCTWLLLYIFDCISFLADYKTHGVCRNSYKLTGFFFAVPSELFICGPTREDKGLIAKVTLLNLLLERSPLQKSQVDLETVSILWRHVDSHSEFPAPRTRLVTLSAGELVTKFKITWELLLEIKILLTAWWHQEQDRVAWTRFCWLPNLTCSTFFSQI